MGYGFSSGRTITAKFKLVSKTFHFVIVGDGWFDLWDRQTESFSQIFTPNSFEGVEQDYYRITPQASAGWEINDGHGWRYERNLLPEQAGQGSDLVIDRYFYDKYPDHATFVYSFLEETPISNEVTVTVYVRKRVGNSWQTTSGGGVGINGSDTNFRDRCELKVPRNSEVTVTAKGAEGYDNPAEQTGYWRNYITGFYNFSGIPYKSISGMHTIEATYTFTATDDTTIYVDFQYVHQ